MQKSLHSWMCICFMALLSNITFAQTEFETAKVQMEKGLYTEALISINQHISKNPTDTKAFLALADVQLKLGKVDLACATFGVVESMKMTNDEFYLEYGKALKMAGKYDEAITKFNMVKGNESKPLSEKQIKSCQQAKDLIRNTEAKRVMNLDVNSEESEFGALMYNNLVFFSSKKAPYMTNESMSALQDYNNNYLCKSLQNGSASALMIESPAYIKNTEAISITDNNKIAFCTVNNNARNIMDRMKSSKISIGDYNGYAIQNIEEFNFNSETYACYSPCLTDGGSTLYFASNMPGGMGGFDIYVSTKEGNAWTTPVNLGNNVNTAGDEITPFYTNNTLWFASNKMEETKGGFDIFTSPLTTDGYVTVRNVEQGINTNGNEFFPMIKNLVVYFTSDKAGGKGGEDIYRCPISNRNSTMELEDQAPVMVQIITNENAPVAHDLYAETYKRSISNADDILSGARRVSLNEYIEKVKAPVFFIQLASMTGNDVNTTKYKPLLKYGNVYKVKVNNVYKIRLGYFLDRSSTESVLAKVRSNGFKDAFIVSEDLNAASLELLLSNTTDNSQTKTSDYSVPSVEKNQDQHSNGNPNFEYSKPLPKNSDLEYKVRLGSYEDPIWFDIKKVRDLGRVEQWTKGAWTIFILGGFNDMADAEQARIQAVNRGFVDAEVVIDNGGIIERIKQN